MGQEGQEGQEGHKWVKGSVSGPGSDLHLYYLYVFGFEANLRGLLSLFSTEDILFCLDRLFFGSQFQQRVAGSEW